MFFCLSVYAFTFYRAFHTLFCLLPAHLHELLSTDRAHSTLTFYVYDTFTASVRYVTDNITVSNEAIRINTNR